MSSTSMSVKLCAACKQCNIAKVKCSGEKTGCERCQSFEVECIYLESRVGKVPGSRARKRKPESGPGFANNSANSQQPQTSDRSIVGSSPETLANGIEDLIMDLSTDIPHNLGSDVMSFGGTTYPFADFFNDESQTLVGSSEPPGLAPPVPCSTSDFRVPDISYSVEGPNPSTPDGDNGHSIRPSPGSNPFASPSSPSKPRSSINSQCILECTQVISNLETYILADLKALDLVLGIVKRTIDKLDELVSLQKDSRDSCCTALFGVAMYQVMQLLEAGCVGLTDSNESTIQGMGDGSQAMAGSYMPVFGLGTFQMDPEEQRAWRAQFVVKELQHSDLILRKMVALSESSQGRDLSKGSEQWYQNVGGRLKALRERIGSGRSSSQIGFG